MTDQTIDNCKGGDFDAEMESQSLISRMIDGETTSRDELDFDALAAGDPSLWRTLAERLRDHARLCEAVRDVVDEASSVDPPGLSQRRTMRLTWPLVLSGWAALLIIAVTWALRTPSVTLQPGIVTPAASPVQHYQRYVEAPFVLAEMDPQVIDIEELSDGRVALRIVRRIEEVVFLDPEAELPIDESGELTRDVALLRALEAGPRD